MGPKTNLARISELPFLEMLSGGTKGKVYELSVDRVSVGRSDDNEIVVSSEAVSRHHAIFECTERGQWIVRDNQSKNGVQVNGAPIQSTPIKNGDVIQVGNFVFRFNDQSGPSEGIANEPDDGMGIEPSSLQAEPEKQFKPHRGISKRVLIYSATGLLLALLYISSNEGEKSPEDKTSGTSQTGSQKLARDFKLSPQSNIDDTSKFKSDAKADKTKIGLEDPELTSAEQQMSKIDWGNSSLKEAEQFFKRGQREYLNKNFARAIEALQTAITMFRGHELAEAYLRLAVYEAENEAKNHMNIAVQYFNALQYQRAIYHFSEVIALMAHRPTEAIVGEAERYIALCRKRLQSVELFP